VLRILGGLSATPAAGAAPVVLWDSFDDDGGRHLSLPLALDRSFEYWQARFVAWRDGLASTRVGGRSLTEALALPGTPRVSLWWPTAVATTAPESLPRVADILKLVIIEQYCTDHGVTSLEYCGDSQVLATVLQRWCRARGSDFAWVRPQPTAPTTTRARTLWYQRLPHMVKAALYLRGFLRRRRAMGRTPRFEASRAPRLAIATYVPNVDLTAATAGEFRSHYWGPLQDLLRALGVSVRWLWVFSDGGGMTLTEAVALQQRLNRAAGSASDEHVFVESAVGPAGLLRALLVYTRLALASVRFRSLRRQFRLPGSAIDFFPLLADDWYGSLRGAGAMYTALYAESYRATIQELPRSVRGLIYVWEHQSWEYLLLAAWRSTCASLALAAAHVPGCTAQMALRNRLGPARRDDPFMMMPDHLVAIGQPAAEGLRNFGWPAPVVNQAEALRFHHLAGSYGRERRPLPAAGRRLLVVCGILPSEVRLQLDLLAAAARLGGLDRYRSVVIKPHPFCPIGGILPEIPPGHHFDVTAARLETLYAETDVVFCASTTSASLDAAWLGMPVILSGAVEGLNLNPFKGIDGVVFATTVSELHRQLDRPSQIPVAPDYVDLDPALPKWRRLLTELLNPSTTTTADQTARLPSPSTQVSIHAGGRPRA